jgi:hypothetical protein
LTRVFLKILFLNWFFFSILSVNIRLLSLGLCDFFCFLFCEVILISYPWSQVNRVNLGCFCFFIWFFFQFYFLSFILLDSWPPLLYSIFFLYRWYWSHDRDTNLTCWFRLGFFKHFLKCFSWFVLQHLIYW